MHKHGTVKLFADKRFIGRAKIIAPFEIRVAFCANQFHRFIVRNARERRNNFFQIGCVAFQNFQFRCAFLQHRLHHVRNHLLCHAHVIVERAECPFRFHHPKFRKMPPRFRFFRAECGTETIHFAERHRIRFVVQLTALREKRGVAVKIRFKQSRRAFHRRGRENRRVHQKKTVIVEPIANRFDDGRANAQNRILTRRTQPQVPVRHQKFNAVFFGRNRKFIARQLHRLHIRHGQFITARRARFFAHLARHDNG